MGVLANIAHGMWGANNSLQKGNYRLPWARWKQLSEALFASKFLWVGPSTQAWLGEHGLPRNPIKTKQLAVKVA